MKIKNTLTQDPESFEIGDVVKNSDLCARIGGLIKRCDMHRNYWKVYTSGDVVTWFESNLEKIHDSNINERP